MRTYIILIATCFLVSCQKYLDKKSDNSLLIPKTLAEINLLLINNDIMNINTSPGLLQITDDVYRDSLTYNSIMPDFIRDLYIWNIKGHPEYVYGANDSWAIPYNAIYYANLCLAKVEKVPKSPANKDEWNKIKGSALFFRAYHMTQLCWTFAKNYDETNNTDPGIVLKLENDFNVPSVRATVKESYTQVLNDARASLEYLPVNSGSVFLPTKKAAYCLLSRVFLSMLKYDSALHYADLFLQQQNALINFNDPAEVNIHLYNSVPEFCKEVVFITSVNDGNFVNLAIDSSFHDSYAANDLRKIALFREGDTYHGKVLTFKRPLFMWSQHFTGIATSEMTITRAECYARMNQPAKALEDLNKLLVNRYDINSFTPITEQDPQQLLQIILTERRKELVVRGLRWMDIKRLNKEFNNIYLTRRDFVNHKNITLQPNDNRYAWPLPTDIIMMTKMQQN